MDKDQFSIKCLMLIVFSSIFVITHQEITVSTTTTNVPNNVTIHNKTIIDKQIDKRLRQRVFIEGTPTLPIRLYRFILKPLKYVVALPKVNSVLKNVGTCVVNGAMEIIGYYFPPTLIPIIATAASMIIPFEPVMMLRDKMPVTSYRRAFMTALNSFLGSFDKYKLSDNDEYDPYMTQRFHRRMMNYGSPEKDRRKRKENRENEE